MKEIPINYLYEIFDIDFEEGVLRWKTRPLSHFKTRRAFSSWNAKYPGSIAGHKIKKGYFKTSINGTAIFCHRVIYAMFFYEWPTCQVDHINRNRDDNRIKNLRSVTNTGNQKNRKINCNNTSGVMGVRWHSPLSKWSSKIGVNGRKRHLGYFTSKVDAIKSRKDAEIKYGFHENHGRNIEVSK